MERSAEARHQAEERELDGQAARYLAELGEAHNQAWEALGRPPEGTPRPNDGPSQFYKLEPRRLAALAEAECRLLGDMIERLKFDLEQAVRPGCRALGRLPSDNAQGCFGFETGCLLARMAPAGKNAHDIAHRLEQLGRAVRHVQRQELLARAVKEEGKE